MNLFDERTDDVPPHSPLLRLENVSRTFLLGEVEVPVLRDVNLSIPRGELTVIVGPSGSGKSTLLNLMGGIDRADSGSIRFREHELETMTDRELTDFRRDHIGFVFQFYNLIPTLTAIENVSVTAELVKAPGDPAEALELVGMSHRADHFPAQLSGGEQQRVSLARALVSRPDLLLCDEPTGALDFQTGRMVLSLLATLNQTQGLTTVIITHNAPIARIANQVVRLGSGTVAQVTRNDHPESAEEIQW